MSSFRSSRPSFASSRASCRSYFAMLCSRKKSLPGKATLPFTAPGNCLFGNVLGVSLALGVGEFLEFLFAHRHHRFGRALKLALRGFAAFGGKGGAGGLLLCGGLGWHSQSTKLAALRSAKAAWGADRPTVYR